MNALGVWGQFFSMAILGLVLWAAVSDLLFRRIPNAAVVSIVLVEAAALAAAALGAQTPGDAPSPGTPAGARANLRG